MKAEELDKIFNEGEDITPYLDLSTADRTGHKKININIDFPKWMLNYPDIKVKLMGVNMESGPAQK